ncbi:MAG: ATP-binding protein [Pseudomonadota bacterium]
MTKGLRSCGALTRVGFDPEAFEIDPINMPCPFPGLAAYDDEDHHAAVFYARGAEIALTIEHLRRQRASGDLSPIGIIGASGSGKSSLIRAGILPRLRREKPWICLRAFRPATTPLLNFSDAIQRTYAMYGRKVAAGQIRDVLRSEWEACNPGSYGRLGENDLLKLRAILDRFAEDLREMSGRADATCLTALDQAEELIVSTSTSADMFADYLRAACTMPAFSGDGMREASGGRRILFTVRTDSYGSLQRHSRFEGLEARSVDLCPLPV